jgi:hypothetical protein
MLVKKKYPLEADNVLGKMIGKARNDIFDQVVLTDSNCENLELEKNVPILNFTEDNDLVERSIKCGEIDDDCLYNKPSESKLVSDKVVFHKTFGDSKFVPRTVFSKEEAKTMKFPLIAKPRAGRSAEGIMRIESQKDLESSEKFDLFSEMIDIDKEYRCFCFRDRVIEINRRVKADDKDFLKNPETTTNFFYKKESFNDAQELEKLLRDCRDRVNLDFFSVDFAVDKQGKLHLIEMNSRTGMGVDKMLDLYDLIHKDFYGKKFPERDRVRKMKGEWKKAYSEEKRVDECTVVGGILDDTMFLFKNRDRSYTPENRVVHTVRDGVEIVYYTDQTGWIEGMNDHGVGFVFSQLTEKAHKGYHPTWYVTDEPKSDSRFEKFRKSILDVLTSRNADEAIKRILASKKSGNFLVADPENLHELEIFNDQHKIRKIEFEESPYYVKTNHGVLFPEAGHQPDGESIKRASSQLRKHQAIQQLKGSRLEDVPSRMKFQAFDQSSPLNTFRTDPEEHTISQCMMDLTSRRFFFFHDPLTADSLDYENDVKNPKIKVEVKTIE